MRSRLPGGTVTAGVGAEYRDEAYETTADPTTRDGNYIGSGGRKVPPVRVVAWPVPMLSLRSPS
jgi:hypothetical protein